ncbi:MULTISPECIES: hypothetical protein [unclassified Agrococcus]|uniref:hypothetical protein n=1 Tax=unclassified Agrococcus TaxID=2615065 RepID=UPI0036188EB8
MSTDQQIAAESDERRPTWGSTSGPRALLPFGVGLVVVCWIAARGSVGGGSGGVTGDGAWLDANGDITTVPPETYSIVLSPSPLVLILALLLLAVAWWTRDARGIPRWLSPAFAASGMLVPIVVIAATWMWIRGFEHPWVLGQAIEGPWWSTTTVTIDRME